MLQLKAPVIPYSTPLYKMAHLMLFHLFFKIISISPVHFIYKLIGLVSTTRNNNIQTVHLPFVTKWNNCSSVMVFAKRAPNNIRQVIDNIILDIVFSISIVAAVHIRYFINFRYFTIFFFFTDRGLNSCGRTSLY